MRDGVECGKVMLLSYVAQGLDCSQWNAAMAVIARKGVHQSMFDYLKLSITATYNININLLTQSTFHKARC